MIISDEQLMAELNDTELYNEVSECDLKLSKRASYPTSLTTPNAPTTSMPEDYTEIPHPRPKGYNLKLVLAIVVAVVVVSNPIVLGIFMNPDIRFYSSSPVPNTPKETI